MNNSRLVKRLKSASRIRCKHWFSCGAKDCNHYETHLAHNYNCIYISPVRYCKRARGFVHDIPANEINIEQECDPNLAFKAQKKADEEIDIAVAKDASGYGIDTSVMGEDVEEDHF